MQVYKFQYSVCDNYVDYRKCTRFSANFYFVWSRLTRIFKTPPLYLVYRFDLLYTYSEWEQCSAGSFWQANKADLIARIWVQWSFKRIGKTHLSTLPYCVMKIMTSTLRKRINMNEETSWLAREAIFMNRLRKRKNFCWNLLISGPTGFLV